MRKVATSLQIVMLPCLQAAHIKHNLKSLTAILYYISLDFIQDFKPKPQIHKYKNARNI